MKSSIKKNKIKFKSEGIHPRLSAAPVLYQRDGRHGNLINKYYLLEGLSRLQKAQTPYLYRGLVGEMLSFYPKVEGEMLSF